MSRWAAAFLFMVVAAIWLATAEFPLIDRLQFVSSVPESAVSAGRQIIQTFTAAADNISRIDLVLMKAPKGPAGELELRIIEPGDSPVADAPVTGKILAETSLDTGTFDYTSIRRLEFEPVPVTAGKTYAFSLTSDDPEASAVEPGSNPKDDYAGGSLYIDGKPAEGDLYFAIFHSASAGGLLEKMEPWRPFPLNNAALVVLLFLVGAGVFGWLLWGLAVNRGDPE